MAERGYTPIHVLSLFSQQSLIAGTSATSMVIDLHNIAQKGHFALAVKTQSGTNGTCGTTVFTYQGASLRNGTYVTPSTATPIGTAGTSGTTDIITFFPEPMPFMKIVAGQAGSAGVGGDTVLTAELIVQ